MDKSEKQKLTVFCQETWHKGDGGRVYKGYNNQYGTVNIGYDIAFNDRFRLQSHLGVRSYDRMWQESNPEVIDTLKSNNGVNQLIVPADISFSWIRKKTSVFSVGIDYQEARYYSWFDTLAGERNFGNKSSTVQGGCYIQEEWIPLPQLTLRGDLRYTSTRDLIELVNAGNPGDNSITWNRLLWSAGIRYSVTGWLSLFANGGSSFSPPGLKSIAGTIALSDKGVAGRNGQLPNPDLKPENGTGVDLGMDFRLPARIKLNFRGFYTVLRDGIIDNVVSLNPSQTQSINTRSTSAGGEIEVSQRVSAAISWYINATLIRSNIRNDLNPDQDNVEIPFSPGFIANAGGSVSAPFGLTFTPSLNYNNGFYDGISKTGRRRYTPGFLLNVYLAQQLARGESYRVDCIAQLYNITNNRYDLPWQFKNTGFSGMFGIKVTF